MYYCRYCIHDDHQLCIGKGLPVVERECKCRVCITELEPTLLRLSLEVVYDPDDFAENVLHIRPYEAINLDDPSQRNAIQRVFLTDLSQQIDDHSYDITAVGVELVPAEETE